MNKIHEWLNTGLILAIGILVLVGGSNQPGSFGSTGTRFPNGLSADSTSPSAGQVRGTTLTVTGATTLGSAGSSIGSVIFGTCSLQVNVSIAATSTQFGFCSGITGLVSTSQVYVSLATTSTAIANQFVPMAVQASTTSSGAFDLKLMNLTGTAAVPAATAGFGSTTRYMIIN